jgi:hypothetical protein
MIVKSDSAATAMLIATAQLEELSLAVAPAQLLSGSFYG